MKLSLFLLAHFPAAALASSDQKDALPLHFDRVTPEVRVIRLAEPAVVSIQTNRLIEEGYYNRFGDWYKTRDITRPYSQGSGALIDAAGYLITNEHVVRGADQIKVQFNPAIDKQEYEAALVNADPGSDLALLKITRKEPFAFLPLGRSDDLLTGERVIAIGNPYGEQNTVTTGILSAIGRDVTIENRQFKDLLQTDASINPGNSGGPLLNINGELIGINNAIHPLAEGIGFAIPVNRVVEILNSRLLNLDTSRRIWFGAKFSETSREPVLESVEPGAPADRAGLKEGDRILAVQGKSVTTLVDFEKAVLHLNPGEIVPLRVARGSKETTASITLFSYLDRISMRRLGMRLESVEIDALARLRVVEVVKDGPASELGIEVGDLLGGFSLKTRDVFGFAREKTFPVTDSNSLLELLEQIDAKTKCKIIVLRKGEKYSGDFTIR